MKKLICGALLSVLFISCGSSDQDTAKKYLPGTYTRVLNKEDKRGVGNYSNKEITIKHLKANEYRITCLNQDDIYYSLDKKVIIEARTPDVFDIEISSITLNQETDSIKKYYIKGIVTNVVSNGTSFSDADEGINVTSILYLTVGKNLVEVTLGGTNISSIRKK